MLASLGMEAMRAAALIDRSCPGAKVKEPPLSINRARVCNREMFGGGGSRAWHENVSIDVTGAKTVGGRSGHDIDGRRDETKRMSTLLPKFHSDRYALIGARMPILVPMASRQVGARQSIYATCK